MMASTDVSRRTIRNSAFWRAIETLGSEGLAFVAFLLLARLLAPEDFGSVALAVSVLVIMQAVLQHGLLEALIQQDFTNDNHWRVAATTNLIISVFLVTLGSLIAWLLPIILRRPNLGFILVALLPTLLLRSSSMIMLASIRREMDFKSSAIRTVISILCGAAVALVSAKNGFGAWSLVAQQWTAEITGFLCFSLSSRHKPWHLGKNRQALKELLPIAFPILSGQFVSNVARRLDVLALGYFLSDNQLGIYFLINRLVLAAQLVTQHGIADVMLTPLSRVLKNEIQFQKIVEKTFMWGLFISCFGLGILSLVGPYLVPLTFGVEWSTSQMPLRWLAAFGSLNAVLVLCGVVLMASNKAATYAQLTSTAAFLQLFFVIICAQGGLMSVIFGIGFAQVLTVIFSIYIIRIRSNISSDIFLKCIGINFTLLILAFSITFLIVANATLTSVILSAIVFISIMAIIPFYIFKFLN